MILRLWDICFFPFDWLAHGISLIPNIESLQLEPDAIQKETKRKRIETQNYKSKRKKSCEYSEIPEKESGKPEKLNRRSTSCGVKSGSPRGLCPKATWEKQAGLSTTCKVEPNAQGVDVWIIDDDKESGPETSSTPGKLSFLTLVLESRLFKSFLFFPSALILPLRNLTDERRIDSRAASFHT